MGLEQARAVLAEEKKRAAEARTAERASTAARLAEARRRELAKKAESVREIRAETTADSVTTEGHGTVKLLGHRSLGSNNPHGVLRWRISVLSSASVWRWSPSAPAKDTKRRGGFGRNARRARFWRRAANVERHRADASSPRNNENKEPRMSAPALVAAKRAEDEKRR